MRTIHNVIRSAAPLLIAAIDLAYDAAPSISQPAPAPNPTARRSATVMVEATDEYGKAECGTGAVVDAERAVLDGGAVTFSLVNVRAATVGGMVWPFATATTPASEGAIVLNRIAEMVGVAFRASRVLDGRNFFVALRAAAPLLADSSAAPAWLRAPAPGHAPAIVSHPCYPVADGAVREGTLVMRAGAGELLRTPWSQTTEAVEPGPFGTLATHTFHAAGQRATHLTLLSAAGVRDVDPYAPPIATCRPRRCCRHEPSSDRSRRGRGRTSRRSGERARAARRGSRASGFPTHYRRVCSRTASKFAPSSSSAPAVGSPR
ncbi:MAG: hypothetical protein FJX78_07565 [Armatimonadetes bacterium]|nr:hypothetical protein [Armatimonadota bacterium]